MLSKFTLDADLKAALKKSQYSIRKYKDAVNQYKNATSRNEKDEMMEIANGIINDFSTDFYERIPENVRLAKLRGVLSNLINTNKDLFGEKLDKKRLSAEVEKYNQLIAAQQEKVNEIKDNIIYKGSFEWRFLFPEILDDLGGFEGFDLVIGNPPYISALDMARDSVIKKYNKTRYPEATGSYDIYILFLRLGIDLTKKDGAYGWIVPNKLLISDYAKKTLEFLKSNGLISSIDASVFSVFKGVGVYPIVVMGDKQSKQTFQKLKAESEDGFIKENFIELSEISTTSTIKDCGLSIMSGATGFEVQKIKKYVNSNKAGIKFTVSGNIDRYEFNNKNVRYMSSKYESAYVQKNDEIAQSKWIFWKNPKIVIAGMTKVIEAVYVEEPLGLGVGCYAIHDFQGMDPKAIVGVLNSKYLSYYLNIKFKDKHLAGGYLAINKSTIEQLPFIKLSKETQNKLATLTDQIIVGKKNNKSTKDFEDKIDAIVYQIYHVSKDVIKETEAFYSKFID